LRQQIFNPNHNPNPNAIVDVAWEVGVARGGRGLEVT